MFKQSVIIFSIVGLLSGSVNATDTRQTDFSTHKLNTISDQINKITIALNNTLILPGFTIAITGLISSVSALVLLTGPLCPAERTIWINGVQRGEEYIPGYFSPKPNLANELQPFVAAFVISTPILLYNLWHIYNTNTITDALNQIKIGLTE